MRVFLVVAVCFLACCQRTITHKNKLGGGVFGETAVCRDVLRVNGGLDFFEYYQDGYVVGCLVLNERGVSVFSKFAPNYFYDDPVGYAGNLRSNYLLWMLDLSCLDRDGCLGFEFDESGRKYDFFRSGDGECGVLMWSWRETVKPY